ncbi:hypothetical protein MTBPR1_10105 [Candidatus Terasakiella magnetica]|uniref:Chemotaxis protein CheZ n=1 Tax=Candidatus Terasakiella magnetica TaxID=1867952 RepID=A0A1C3RC84_9PROT|nr:hypothetical protein [Candidatus Terasakiella magnetica]SCA54858.1 hypothetical protein MTBPR1_10105 [Candidatus Terasakiella magnetica]
MSNSEHNNYEEALEHWLRLSAAQRHGLTALAKEVETASELVETSVEKLSDRFMNLAFVAGNQSEQINVFAKEATTIKFDGKIVPLTTVLNALDDNLNTSLNKIIDLSEGAESLSDVLEGVDGTLKAEFAKQENGQAIDTSVLNNVCSDLDKVKQAIKEVASIDVVHKVQIKEQFKDLIEYVVKQSNGIEEVLTKSQADSSELSKGIADIVMRMQFQDRTSQRLSHISATLNVIVEMLVEMEKTSSPSLGKDFVIEPDKAWIENMISGFHLGEMRERFVKHTLFDDGEDIYDEQASGGDLQVEHAESSDDIELF